MAVHAFARHILMSYRTLHDINDWCQNWNGSLLLHYMAWKNSYYVSVTFFLFPFNLFWSWTGYSLPAFMAHSSIVVWLLSFQFTLRHAISFLFNFCHTIIFISIQQLLCYYFYCYSNFFIRLLSFQFIGYKILYSTIH